MTRPDAQPKSPYGVICDFHGTQGLTREEYDRQMNMPNARWRCPICKDEARWDDERFEDSLDQQEPETPTDAPPDVPDAPPAPIDPSIPTTNDDPQH